MISGNVHSKVAESKSYTREYRVVRVRSIHGTHYLAVHEVTFSEGKINWVADMPPYKTGSLSELREWHKSLASAFDKPVIDATTLSEIPSFELAQIILADELALELFKTRSMSILKDS